MKLVQLWRDPNTTLVLISLYLLVVLSGFWRGQAELWDPQAHSSGRLVQISTQDRRVAISGQILRLSFREHRTRAFLSGDATLDVRVSDLRHAALVLTIECRRVLLPGDRILFQRAGGADRVVLTELEEWRRRVTIPLPDDPQLQGRSQWQVLPSTNDLRYRIISCDIVPRAPDALAPAFETLRQRSWQQGPFRISAGSGWWWPQEALGEGPLPGINYQTERRAYLIVETDQPGRYWLKAPFAAVSPTYKLPTLLVDGMRTAYHHGPMSTWGGMTAQIEVGRRTVLGFLNDGRVLSPYEFGENNDHRPISYAFQLAELKIEPPE